jgi:hypothetical protein
LEVVLSVALALILLAALYTAMDLELREADIGRELVQQATLSRAIIQKLGSDIIPALAPVVPVKASSTTTTTDPLGALTDPTMTSDADAAAAEALQESAPYIAGVVGEEKSITLFVAKTASGNPRQDGMVANPADIRRICIWMTDNGLARQELTSVLSETTKAIKSGPDLTQGDEASYIFAEEVVDITFEYWDGASFSASWDGSVLGADNKTLLGPPLAVRVTLTLQLPTQNPNEPVQKTIRHTFALQAAPGPSSTNSTPLEVPEP